jgi:GNAT superfamily N-acetyltransferase
VQQPSSLELVDVVGNGMDCERFLWIRGLRDPQLPRIARIDLVDAVQRHGDRVIHACSRDGMVAATVAAVAEDRSGQGTTFLSVHAGSDPDEPLLGDIVELALRLSRSAGTAAIRCSAGATHPIVAALTTRHGFVEQACVRCFHVDVDAGASLDAVPLPPGIEASTLAQRSDLATAAFDVWHACSAQVGGDAPLAAHDPAGWLASHDASPTGGRAQVLLLHEADRVDAVLELRQRAAGSDQAEVAMLAVRPDARGRGLGLAATQAAPAVAAACGMRRLHASTRTDNAAGCRLNERAGWIEDEPRVILRRAVEL